MRDVPIKRVLTISILLSLMLHLIFLCLIAFVGFRPSKKVILPDLYQPAYLYQGSIVPAAMLKAHGEMESPETNQMAPSTQVTSSNNGTILLHESTKKQITSGQYKKIRQRSVMKMTYEFLRQHQQETVAVSDQADEPIYLVGDLNSPVNPLIRLLGRALSKNFGYPHAAGAFGIKGRAIVSLVLHPNGQLSNIHLLQSTENQDLDAAALYAANNAPIVKGADKFLSKPKRFVIGFIFR